MSQSERPHQPSGSQPPRGHPEIHPAIYEQVLIDKEATASRKRRWAIIVRRGLTVLFLLLLLSGLLLIMQVQTSVVHKGTQELINNQSDNLPLIFPTLLMLLGGGGLALLLPSRYGRSPEV